MMDISGSARGSRQTQNPATAKSRTTVSGGFVCERHPALLCMAARSASFMRACHRGESTESQSSWLMWSGFRLCFAMVFAPG
jgi:hypothetical protein